MRPAVTAHACKGARGLAGIARPVEREWPAHLVRVRVRVRARVRVRVRVRVGLGLGLGWGTLA